MVTKPTIRPLPSALFALLLSGMPPLYAAGPLPDFSALAEAAKSHRVPLPWSPERQALVAAAHPPTVVEGLGVPGFLWTTAQTPPSMMPRIGSQAGDAQWEQLARNYLYRYAAIYRLDAQGLASARLHHIHRGTGPTIAKFTQEADGIEVFGQEISLLMKQDGELAAISGYLSPHVASAATAQFKQSAASAITAAFTDYSGGERLAEERVRAERRQGKYQWYTVPRQAGSRAVLSGSVRVKPVFYPHADRLEAAYYLELTGGAFEYAYVISAVDGRLLQRSNLTVSEQAGISAKEPAYTYSVWAEAGGWHVPVEGPQGGGLNPNPSGVPDDAPLSFIPQTSVTLPCLGSPCAPWIAAGKVGRTVGNNVSAYADLVEPDGFNRRDGDYRAVTTSDLTFSYPYDLSLSGDANPTQVSAGIVQAFYTTNFLHDVFYAHGFTAAAGNGQRHNYGYGGIEGDPVLVETQDYSGFDNADMAAHADGNPPRMQLYLWHFNDKHFLINTPAGLAGEYSAGSAVFGAQTFAVTGDLVLANDGVDTVSDGCETPFINASRLAGKVALIDRGICTFVDKANNAQAAGAAAVVIADNVEGASPPAMAGSDAGITIPVLSVQLATGNSIKTALAAGQKVNVTMSSVKFLRDSALDNTIVAHEWAHYLSGRLIGNGNGLSNNQGGSLGEGWSDFVALMLMVKAEDRDNPAFPGFSGSYAMANYVADAPVYFGLRRYPYSTDMGKNPLTFKHIENGVALPSGVPINPTRDNSSTLNGSANSEVHDSGEVWTAMLWEAYAALLNDAARLSFDQARDRMLDYLVAALEMTPINPTFTEARDALLSVAQARNRQDYNLFWQAFAKRGMGVDAVSPPRRSTTNEGVVEDYSTP